MASLVGLGAMDATEVVVDGCRNATSTGDLTDDGGWITLAIEDPKSRIHFGFQFAGWARVHPWSCCAGAAGAAPLTTD